jgi:uncharacterized membrane protein
MMTATIQLPRLQPAPVFGMALFLTVLLMGLICYQFSEALAPVALSSVALLLYVWHNLHFSRGQAVTFSFSASFAQDLTYSLGWASYAFLLLIIGVRKGSRTNRVGGLGLFLVAATKVFIFDVWRLGQLYRVASLVGLALFLFLVTFLYQRYLSAVPEKHP